MSGGNHRADATWGQGTGAINITVSSQISEQPRERSVDLSEPLLTAPAAAALLSVRTSWIYEAARNGTLPCVRLGKHVRFLRADLEGWIAAQRAAWPGGR